MQDSHGFLQALTIVLGVAAVTTVLCQRLHQPVVLGYILAGLIVGPHVPIPLVADPEVVQTLSELGVILLMFALGLDFSLAKLLRVGPSAGPIALLQCSVMIWLGFVTGRAFGWTVQESLFTGAIVAISSTTIIAKAFDEERVRGRLREVVVGILIVEDLVAVLLMAVLTTISTGLGLEARALALTMVRLLGLLVGIVVLGLLVVPRAVRAIQRLEQPETTLVASLGLCFAIALLVGELGYSVALGAFIAGSLVAESGEEEGVARVVAPVRDMFAAIFFVSVGMLIDPALVAQHWPAVVVLTAVVLVGKIGSVSVGAFFTGAGTRTSLRAGMSLAQIGEFSFIIAGLGLALGATGDFLYPVAVAVSAATTLTTPWLIRASDPLATLVDRKLPRPLQTFAALYASWVEHLRTARRRRALGSDVQRLVRLLVLDGTVLGALTIGTSLAVGTLASSLVERLGIEERPATWIVVGIAVALSSPFWIGIVRVARRLALALAGFVLPDRSDAALDLAAAPRQALVGTLHVAIVLVVGAPLVAVTQPFLRGFSGAVILAAVLALLAFAFWRSAKDLEGHVRAGAQVLVETLANQSRGRSTERVAQEAEPLRALLPGLGDPVAVALASRSPAVGRTLGELNLRGLTGATVLVVTRGSEGGRIPTAHEPLRAGDVLALAGTLEAIDAARCALLGPEDAPASSS